MGDRVDERTDGCGGGRSVADVVIGHQEHGVGRVVRGQRRDVIRGHAGGDVERDLRSRTAGIQDAPELPHEQREIVANLGRHRLEVQVHAIGAGRLEFASDVIRQSGACLGALQQLDGLGSRCRVP